MTDSNVACDTLWARGNLRPRFSYIEVHFKCDLPTTPVFKVSMAKLVRASPYFRRLLDMENKKPENIGATVITVSYMNLLPGSLRIMLSWVDTGEFLETRSLKEYSNLPSGKDTSPWMTLILVYLAANRFEMLELKDMIMYKIVEMAFAAKTVPCGTLKTIYLFTEPGDGMRRLMMDLIAYRVPLAVYQIHFLSWNLEMPQDLLIAVQDAYGEEPYALSLMKYLSVI